MNEFSFDFLIEVYCFTGNGNTRATITIMVTLRRGGSASVSPTTEPGWLYDLFVCFFSSKIDGRWFQNLSEQNRIKLWWTFDSVFYRVKIKANSEFVHSVNYIPNQIWQKADMFWSNENYVLIIKRRSFLLNSVPDIDFQFELR